ncbi:hypothetical protein [uncultured Desulfovibrio sp.]|uniref:hypothetical protein n=1 Tax=uncultured Desulfovibrio sp. TaxID=167968 RepID=UPI00260BB179|nr:hypothetical protein [uncultured Desulfovibrio sp.]
MGSAFPMPAPVRRFSRTAAQNGLIRTRRQGNAFILYKLYQHIKKICKKNPPKKIFLIDNGGRVA